MTSPSSPDLKEVIFINQAVYNVFLALPQAVLEAASARTTILQNGGRLPAQQMKMLKGALSGVSEIRVLHDNDTFRVYFAASFERVVYILDAGIKKSPAGGEIPRPQIERLVTRLRQARQHYADFADELATRFAARAVERAALAAAKKPG